jgi:hypothetical protein
MGKQTFNVDKNSDIDTHCRQSMIDSVMKSNIMGYINGHNDFKKSTVHELCHRKRSSSFTKQNNLKETSDL